MADVSLPDRMKLLVIPALTMKKRCIERGERQTFPFLDRIRRQCIIEQVIDASVELVARASANTPGASVDGILTPTMEGAPRPLKRESSFFEKVLSWMWLDASALIGSGSVSSFASRILKLGASASAGEKQTLDREREPERNDGAL